MNRKQRRATAKLARTSSHPPGETAAAAFPAGVEDLLAAGHKLHQAGRLAEAEVYYRRVLTAQPTNDDALNLLGVIAHQTGRHELAVKVIRQAIRKNGQNAGSFSNLGNVFYGNGKLDEAIAAYRQAINIKPDFVGAHNNLGLALKDQGKLDEAIAAYCRAINIKPDFVGAHNNLGLALKDQGKLDEAVAAYRQAIKIKADFFEAHQNLGVALKEQGKVDEAVAAYRQAISIKPDLTAAHFNLGVALKEQGKVDEAVAAYRQAISIKPDFAEAHNNLGAMLTDQGKLDDAVAQYQKAVTVKPDFAEAHNNLGKVLRWQGKPDEAVAHYRQALAIRPDCAEAHNNLGNILRWHGKSDEAVACYRQALVIKPDYAEVYNNLGIVLRDLGSVEEARIACEKAIELAPRNPAFHYSLATLKRFVPGDRQLEALEAIASEETSLSTDDRIYLHFALAKGYDDGGDYERSFARLRQANSLKRQQIAYDESVVQGLFARLQQVFTPELMRDKRGLGDPSSVPVFIIGMPRSGTTLIEQILASHPKVFGAGELMNLANAVAKLSRKAPFPGAISTMAGEELRELGAHYVAEIRQLAPEADRIIDKMPANFRLAGLIHLALPNARIIHVRRDPLDTCLSCFSKLFGNDQPFSYDLGELGRYYRGYEMLMEHWRRVLPPGVMLEVQYEQLVADLEGEGRRIVGHCGLEWDAACLSFHDTERQVRTASAVQVRQPIYRSSIGRWRAYEQHLAPLIEALGVDVAGGSRRAPSAGVEDRWATSAGGLPPLVTDKATVDERAYGRDVPALRRSLGETAGRLEEGDTPTS